MKYRKSVFVITYHIDKNKIYYLLLKRKLHWIGWEFPKGGIEKKDFKRKLKPKETIGVLGAVKREIKEETGQVPKNIKKYSASGKFKYEKEYSDREGFVGQTYKLFSAELKDKNIKFDKHEHSGYKWVNFETAWKMLKWPNQKICLKIVNKRLK